MPGKPLCCCLPGAGALGKKSAGPVKGVAALSLSLAARVAARAQAALHVYKGLAECGHGEDVGPARYAWGALTHTRTHTRTHAHTHARDCVCVRDLWN